MRHLLLLALTVALLLAACGKTPPAEEPAITDLSVVTTSSIRLGFAGRRVSVENVVVTAVIGDILFVAAQNGASLPMSDTAELHGQPNPKVLAGQRLRISGEIGDLANPPNPQKFWNMITEAERAMVMAHKVYLSAEVIAIY